MVGHRISRLASRLLMAVLGLCCGALVHCVQLQDGPGGAGGNGGGAAAWGTAVQIHDAGSAPAVAVDAGGNAIAVWTQTNDFWSSRYTSSDGWSPAEIISGGGDPLPTATVAMDAAGNALAVWTQFFINDNVFTNRYTPSGGWRTSHGIDDNNGDGDEPQIAMSADGDAVAVWVQDDGTRDDVWSNRYVPGSSWDAPERIENNNTVEASGPQVAMNRNGDAIAVWAQLDGTRWDIWSNRTSNGRWGSARRVESNNEGDALEPQVGVDADGNAIAVWKQFDGVTFDIWSSRYTSSWGTPARIEDEDEGDASDPRIAVASDGSAVAVWTQTQSDGVNEDIWSNRYTPSDGWGTAERIETDDAGSASEARVAVDPSGIAVAVWTQFDGTGDNIWSNRRTPNGGWGTAGRIDADDRGTLSNPQVVMDPSGTAVAVWRVFGGPSHGIWSNRLEAEP